MPTITLQQPDARLLYLALIYHLARPGAELDRTTKQPLEHGLLEVAQSLHDQLNSPAATLELSDTQVGQARLAMLGTVNELKVYPMLPEQPASEGGGRRSTVRDFDHTLRTLFPGVEREPDLTLELAARMLQLRRRVEAAAPREAESAPSPAPASPRWQFWRR